MLTNVQKYLDRYAEKEIHVPVEGTYDECVALPLCGEDEFVDDLFASLERAASYAQKKVLAIGVINEAPTTDPVYRASNQKLLERFGHFVEISRGFHFFPIDRVKEPFEDKQGVGLARKIGCDIALSLRAKGQLRSSWVHTTDGDARVSDDYFIDDISTHIRGLVPSHVGAEIFPYEHVGTGTLMEAHTTYENWMDSYVTGLEKAGSPYAFPTIGSTLKIHLDTYADVRGFPRKSAAEDFYLLNKIAKVAGVRLRTTGKVTLRARPSHRVPFGTGVGVGKILNAERDFAPYPTLSFDALNEFYRREAPPKESRHDWLFFHRNFDALRVLQAVKRHC